jgi:hypothetical protein
MNIIPIHSLSQYIEKLSWEYYFCNRENYHFQEKNSLSLYGQGESTDPPLNCAASLICTTIQKQSGCGGKISPADRKIICRGYRDRELFLYSGEVFQEQPGGVAVSFRVSAFLVEPEYARRNSKTFPQQANECRQKPALLHLPELQGYWL